MVSGKKGLSDIITTILLVLLTMAIAAALLAFLRPYVQNNLNSSTECIAYQDYYQFQQTFVNNTGTYNYNCFIANANDSGALISISVASGTNLTSDEMISLSGFSLVFSTSTNSVPVMLINGQDVNKTVGGIWRIDDPTNSILNINQPNEVITYVYNSSAIYSTVDVYPVLKDGTTCPKSDTITLVPCSGVGLS